MTGFKETIGSGLRSLNGALYTVYQYIPKNVFWGLVIGVVGFLVLIIVALKRNH